MMARQGGGKIVNIASLSSFQGGWTIPAPPSTASPASRRRWRTNGPREHQRQRHRAGLFETDMCEALVRDPVREPKIRDRIPAGRWGRPEDMVGPLLFLVSDARGTFTVTCWLWMADDGQVNADPSFVARRATSEGEEGCGSSAGGGRRADVDPKAKLTMPPFLRRRRSMKIELVALKGQGVHEAVPTRGRPETRPRARRGCGYPDPGFGFRASTAASRRWARIISSATWPVRTAPG